MTSAERPATSDDAQGLRAGAQRQSRAASSEEAREGK